MVCVVSFIFYNVVEGTVWHVFDIDAKSGTIIPVNTFSYSSDPSTLLSVTRNNEAEILAILGNLPAKADVQNDAVQNSDEQDNADSADRSAENNPDESVTETIECDETEIWEEE